MQEIPQPGWFIFLTGNSLREIPVELISPNPYQPRRDFNESNLSSLAESIRQYGVMQPIVVTKKKDDSFELISGERRLRASKIAGKQSIPAIIRNHEHSDGEKFELAIIENLQREDLNPVDRARSFKRLVEEFDLTHGEIAQKMGKSREYISNSLRLLTLPDNILDAIISEINDY
jgi:ParB family chromosome partitioning protein